LEVATAPVAKILTIGEGAAEVQQMVIARQLGC
jgi:hypothetical protein